MANPTTTVTDYCQVLRKSRLIPPAELEVLASQWRQSPQFAEADVDSFRKYLVNRRYLTEYQAALIQRGHSEGFFIGGYVILDRIGKGQTAGVYKAMHASGQVVAVKVLPTSKARNPQVLARFQREGRLLTQLDHPNTLRAFQVVSPGEGQAGPYFIAMEYLEGETLDDVLARRKQLPPAEAARIIYQALQGLQHLHERRMVHRDLKPANLMLTPAPGSASTLDCTVKILDIGLARELFDETNPNGAEQALTIEGTVLGTPDYLAPEQARDPRTADIRADIYSLGCVLYHCLAGRPPFVEKSVMAVMVRHASEAPQPITQLNPSVPPGLQVVLNTMLAKDAIGRYQTPAMAADALRPFLPAQAQGPRATSVVPAYSHWLAQEAQEEPVQNPKPMFSSRPVAAATPSVRLGVDAEMPPVRGSGPVSNPTRVAAVAPDALPVDSPKLRAEAPTPPVAASPSSSSTPSVNPPRARTTISGPPSGKIKLGTGLAGALANATAAPAAPIPPTLKPPSVPARPSPLPATAPTPGSSAAPPGSPAYDVELVAPAVTFPADLVENNRIGNAPMRPLYDLDRRDFIMLSIGASSVLGAIALGLIVAKWQRNKLRGPSNTEE